MAHGGFKDLPQRTASNKILQDKHLLLLKTQNMMDIEEVLLQCFINVFIKRLKVVK